MSPLFRTIFLIALVVGVASAAFSIDAVNPLTDGFTTTAIDNVATVTGSCVTANDAGTGPANAPVAVAGTIQNLGSLIAGTGFVASRTVWCTMTDGTTSISTRIDTLPPRPTNVAVSSATSTSLTISATLVAQTSAVGVSAYSLFSARCKPAINPLSEITMSSTVDAGATTASVEVTGLSPSVQYSCIAQLVNDIGKYQDASKAVLGTTLDPAGVPVVTSVTITAGAVDPANILNTIKLNIQYTGIGTGGKVVGICGSKGQSADLPASSGSGSTLTVTVSNLAATTKYNCYVVVFDSAGNTATSADVTGITTYPRPASVSNVTGVAPDTLKVEVKHDTNSGDSGSAGDTITINSLPYTSRAFTYNPVVAAPITCKPATVGSGVQPPVLDAPVALGASLTTAMVTGLSANVRYYCLAVLRNEAGRTAATSSKTFGTTLAAQRPNAPSCNVVPVDFETVKVSLSWSKTDQNGAPVTLATVSCAPAEGGPSEGGLQVTVATDIISGDVTTATKDIIVQGLREQTAYACYGNITNSAGTSDNSPLSSVTTLVAPPPEPTPSPVPVVTPAPAEATPTPAPAPAETTTAPTPSAAPAPAETTTAPTPSAAPAPAETTTAPTPSAAPAPATTTAPTPSAAPAPATTTAPTPSAAPAPATTTAPTPSAAPAPAETTTAPTPSAAPAPAETTTAPTPSAVPAPATTTAPTPLPAQTTTAPTPLPAQSTTAPTPLPAQSTTAPTPLPAQSTTAPTPLPAQSTTAPTPLPAQSTTAPTPLPAQTTTAPAAPTATPAPAQTTAPAAPTPKPAETPAPTSTPLPGFDSFGCRLQPQWVTATLYNATTVRIQWGPSQAGSSQPLAGKRTLLASANSANAGTDDDDLGDGIGYSKKYRGCHDWAVGLYLHGQSYAINSARWASESLATFADDQMLVSVGATYKMNRAVLEGTFYDVRLVLVRTGQARQLGAATTVVEFPKNPTASVAASTSSSITVSIAPWAFSKEAYPGSFPGLMFGLNGSPAMSLTVVASSLAAGAAPVKATAAATATSATVSGLAADTAYIVEVQQSFTGLPGLPLAASRAFVKTAPAAGRAASTAATDIPVAALFSDADLADYVDDGSLPAGTTARAAGASLTAVSTLTLGLAGVPCSSLTSDLAKAILNDLRAVLGIQAASVKLATIRCVPTTTATTSTGSSGSGNSNSNNKKNGGRRRGLRSDAADSLQLVAAVRAPAEAVEAVSAAVDAFAAQATRSGLALNAASTMLGTSVSVDAVSSSRSPASSSAGGLPVGVVAGIAGIVGGVVAVAVIVGVVVARRQRAVARARASAAAQQAKAKALGKAPSAATPAEAEEGEAEGEAVVTQMASVLGRQPSLRRRGDASWNPLRRLHAVNNAVAPEPEPEEESRPAEEAGRPSSPRSPVSLRSPSMEVRDAEEAATVPGVPQSKSRKDASVVFVSPALGDVNPEVRKSREAKLGVPKSGSSRRARPEAVVTIPESPASEAQAHEGHATLPRRLPPLEGSISPRPRASLTDEDAEVAAAASAAHESDHLAVQPAAVGRRSPGHAVRGGYAAVEGGHVLDIAINRKGGKPLRK